MFIKPWNDWYHCIGNTYGTWLRADDRRWRARHHREHVEGDYRHPPPDGAYEDEFRQSRQSMKCDAVVFAPEIRPIVCRLFGDALLFYQVEFVDLSVGAMHFHLLARFTNCIVESPRPLAVGFRRSSGAYRHTTWTHYRGRCWDACAPTPHSSSRRWDTLAIEKAGSGRSDRRLYRSSVRSTSSSWASSTFPDMRARVRRRGRRWIEARSEGIRPTAGGRGLSCSSDSGAIRSGRYVRRRGRSIS